MAVRFKILLVCTALTHVLAYPQTVTDTSSLIVSSTESSSKENGSGSKEGSDSSGPTLPKIYEMRVDSNVSNRFANTLVTSKVKNLDDKAHEVTFSVILPEKAFISKFVMEIGGKNYEAYIKEKEEAKKIYDQAVESGLGAAHVTTNIRDSNRFTVSVNIEPRSKAVFYLTYEELLERKYNHYELVLNIHPKQPVKDLFVNVHINESLPLKYVNAPPIRSGNDVSDPKGDLDPRAQINKISETCAIVFFNPNLERQKELAKTLGTNDDEGLSGQFIVQYDVERNSGGGEVLLQDGYFVHFFSPPDLPPLTKHVLFVLDTSGSMYGQKMDQLKAAMKSILSELKNHDLFHLIDFNTFAKVLNLYNSNDSVTYPTQTQEFYFHTVSSTENITDKVFPSAYSVNPDNIKKANELVSDMEANGGTNIHDALKVALYLVDVEKHKNSNQDAPQPLIIFLTDGDATVGVTNQRDILSGISELNKHSVPIFSLAFGADADSVLLQKLSLRNNGFSRNIYEAADASLQLQDFYRQISSPLLSNVKFKYTQDAKELTKTDFPIFFDGSEIVVAGALDKEFPELPQVSGFGFKGPIDLVPKVARPVTNLEKLWAYLTIQQLLDDREIAENKTQYEKKALDLALKYSFVTPLSSLVVVKPNATESSVSPESANDKGPDALSFATLSAPPPGYNNGAPLLASAFGPQSFSPAFGGSFPLSLSEVDRTDTVAEDDEGAKVQYFSTTAYLLTTTPSLSKLEILKSHLPWIDNTILNDDIFHSSKGDLKLGLNETTTEHNTCPNSPKNGEGICKLLHECPEVHYLLTSVYIFEQYYCPLNDFVAICCPPKHD